MYSWFVATSGDVILALASGAFGAISAQILAIWQMRQLEGERTALTLKLEKERQAFEVHRTKLEALRKIAGSRAALTASPLSEHRSRFFEGLNEVMVIFSDSNTVSGALVAFKAALGTINANDCLVDLFKAMCRDVGTEPSAFNDSLFLQPFQPTL